MLRHLYKPVKTRQDAKKTIKKELDDHKANYPQDDEHVIKRKRREKDRDHDLIFLKNVI